MTLLAFTLKIFSPLTTSASAGWVELLAYHGATDAPTVDVQVMGGDVLIDDLTYGMFTDGYLSAPAVDLVLEVTLGNDNDAVVAAYDAPLSALDGAGAVVFASGFLSGGDGSMLPGFGLFVALADGTVIELSESVVSTESTSWTGVKNLYDSSLFRPGMNAALPRERGSFHAGHGGAGSGQEGADLRQLPRQVLVDHVIESVLGQGLLLGAHPHLDHLLEGLLPGLVVQDEGVVLERVLGALDVDLLQRMGREVVVEDVLGGHAEEPRPGNAEELVDVGGVTRADLERPVDVGDAVRIAVDERVHRQVALVREPPHEPARRPGRHAGHRHQDALRLLPELVALETLEHAAGLDLSLIHISEPTRQLMSSRMPSSA